MIPFIWHFRKGKTVGTEIGSVTASSYWLAEGQTRMGRKELFMVIEGFCISIVVVVTGLLHLSKLTEMYTLKGWILMHINHTSINKQKIYNLPQKNDDSLLPFPSERRSAQQLRTPGRGLRGCKETGQQAQRPSTQSGWGVGDCEEGQGPMEERRRGPTGWFQATRSGAQRWRRHCGWELVTLSKYIK